MFYIVEFRGWFKINIRQWSKGKIKIGIQVKVTSSSCSIHIRDNGIGISSSVLPHIFQLFYRGSDKSTGSGVGLYIVKEVIEKMQGTIRVESIEGAGTSFFVTIPLQETQNTSMPTKSRQLVVSREDFASETA